MSMRLKAGSMGRVVEERLNGPEVVNPLPELQLSKVGPFDRVVETSNGCVWVNDECLYGSESAIAEYYRMRKEGNMGPENAVDGMLSEDYKERFRAEYMQTLERYNRLDDITIKYEPGTLDFEPQCSLELLMQQKHHMGMYLRCLRIRAEIEDINLRN